MTAMLAAMTATTLTGMAAFEWCTEHDIAIIFDMAGALERKLGRPLTDEELDETDDLDGVDPGDIEKASSVIERFGEAVFTVHLSGEEVETLKLIILRYFFWGIVKDPDGFENGTGACVQIIKEWTYPDLTETDYADQDVYAACLSLVQEGKLSQLPIDEYGSEIYEHQGRYWFRPERPLKETFKDMLAEPGIADKLLPFFLEWLEKEWNWD